MTYTLSFTKHSLKKLAKINEPDYSKIKHSIQALTNNPRPQGNKKLKGINLYRIRVGNYRVLYSIFDHQLVINVIALGHRKEIYRKKD